VIGGPVRRAELVLALAFALTACGARPAPTTALTPQPFTPPKVTVAVSDGAVKLLETRADSDVVSPAGIDAALCALVPVMSDAVRRQRRNASERDCGPAPAYVTASLWIEQSERINPDAETLLRARTELHRDPAPISALIDRWLDDHHALHVPLAEPLALVSISALDYGRPWANPFFAMRNLGTFRGKQRIVRVRFLQGWQFESPVGPSCVRGVMLTADGGYVMLAELGSRPPAVAFHCLGHAVMPRKLKIAFVTLPRLHLSRTASIRERLQRLGFRDAFDPAAEPFPKLWRGAALHHAIQAAELDLDENGIRVRATTMFDIPLGVPRSKLHLTYDRPFAMRVVDAGGTTVAVAIVNDLPAR